MYKGVELNRGTISSIVGAAMNDYNGQRSIVPVSKRGRSNMIVRSGSGDYDGGDRVIGFTNGYEIDGDLLFTVGWGDGFAVRRLNDDGTLTRLYWENNFLYRDTGSVYNHLQSIAIDKVNKKGVVMTYNVYGYTTFDYSGLMNGGTNFVKDPRPSHSNPQIFIGSQDTGNGYVRRVGNSYYGGLAAAGEWIYAHEHDARHYKKVMRRNLRTGEEQRLYTPDHKFPGSGDEDRNGYRGYVTYDEVNDRIYYCTYYNANFTLVLNASTANPQTVWCDVGDMGYGDDGYEQGLFVFDPVNQPNIISIGSSTRHIKIDITPCFTGGDPSLISRVHEQMPSRGNFFGVNMRAGTKYQSESTPTDRMIGYPDFVPVSPDRGRAMSNYGWIDYENENYVAQMRPDNVTEDTSSFGRGNTLWTDYGLPIVKMNSTNGTPYWIQMGYGYHGHSFTIWSDEYANHLIPDWEVIHYAGGLDNDANIDFVFWDRKNYYTPSGTNISFFVSNNNGQNWEIYSGTESSAHTFANPGNRLRVKIIANGNVSKNAYKMGGEFDSVLFGTLYAAAKDPSIKSKFARNKIRGKK